MHRTLNQHRQATRLFRWEQVSTGLGSRNGAAYRPALLEPSVYESNAWAQGLNRLMRAIDDLAGHKIGEAAEAAQVALFMRAWNTIYCAFDLARRGYYPQALNLLRTPIEDWMAYWYLRNFPEEYERFLDLNQETLTFNDMLTRIEGKQGKPPDRMVRVWINRLHSYSHVDREGIRMIMRNDGEVLHYGLGPAPHEVQFRYCVSEALGVIGAHLQFRCAEQLPPARGRRTSSRSGPGLR